MRVDGQDVPSLSRSLGSLNARCTGFGRTSRAGIDVCSLR